MSSSTLKYFSACSIEFQAMHEWKEVIQRYALQFPVIYTLYETNLPYIQQPSEDFRQTNDTRVTRIFNEVPVWIISFVVTIPDKAEEKTNSVASALPFLGFVILVDGWRKSLPPWAASWK